MTKHRRLAWFHRNLVEQDLDAELGKHILHEIVLAHRNAARYQKNVKLQALPDFSAKVFKIVSRNSKMLRRGARFQYLRMNRVTVAVAYLAGSRSFLYLDQF